MKPLLIGLVILAAAGCTPKPPRAPLAPAQHPTQPQPPVSPQKDQNSFEARHIALLCRDKRTTGKIPTSNAEGFRFWDVSKPNAELAASSSRPAFVMLPRGEQLRALFLGDSSNWIAEKGASGTPPHQYESLAIKPKHHASRTLRVILLTDKRRYFITIQRTNRGLNRLVYYDCEVS